MAEDKEPTLEELMAELDAGLTLEGGARQRRRAGRGGDRHFRV